MSLKEALEAGKFLITAEVGPGKGTDTEHLLKDAEIIKDDQSPIFAEYEDQIKHAADKKTLDAIAKEIANAQISEVELNELRQRYAQKKNEIAEKKQPKTKQILNKVKKSKEDQKK